MFDNDIDTFKMYRLLLLIFSIFSYVYCDDISATITSDNVLNIVSDKFISFTIDPHILIERNNTENSQECLCMANLLSPAYLRITGPSTEHIAIEESVIKFNTINHTKTDDDDEIETIESNVDSVETTSVDKWKNFMNWIKLAGLTPIVALNNGDRLPCGNWNPKTTVQALSIVEQSNIGECVWQLGDECKNQTMQKYMNDLQVLKILIDAFASGKTGKWKIVSADVSQCLGDDASKNLLSFLLDSNSFINAAILNSNETSDVLNILTHEDREKVQRQFMKKNTQLWKTIKYNNTDDDDALIWLKSIGNAARDGYSVIFKDLTMKDLEEWSMSYYASLIHKKFVGPEVLNITLNTTDVKNISLYGHCSTLPSGPKTSGVTIYATNEGDVLQTIVLNISNEEEGEIMQFIMKKNDNGTVVINGKETFNDGDMQPDVRQVKPFKAIKVTLPPKSIGFWIFPTADVKACYGDHNNVIRRNRNKNMGTGRIANTLFQILSEGKEMLRIKRSNNDVKNYYNIDDSKAFELLDKIEKMLNLEDQFIELGEDLLKSNYFDDHVRVIRDVEEQVEVDDNLKEETKVESSDIKPENKSSTTVEKNKLPKLPKLSLKDADDRLTKLVDKARSVIKNLDMDPSENVNVESVAESPKLRSRIKQDLIKHDIKFGEIKNRMKARLAELNLKAKLNPTKITKREIDVTSNENMIEDFDTRDYLLLNDVKTLEDENHGREYIDYEVETVTKNDADNMIIKKTFDDSSEELIINEKLTLNDLKENIETSQDMVDDFMKMFKGFFSSFRDTLSDWWNNLNGMD